MERHHRPSRSALRTATETTEAALAAAWEECRYGELVDDRGHALRVVFPGRRWGGPGPDFRGALLAHEDGKLVRGDVELHVRASGWRLHGHAGNPAYARVILHVVAAADEPTAGAGGALIPTAVLPATRVPPRASEPPCCQPADEVVALVADAGRRRFAAHAARFEGDIAAVGPDQALWRGVAEALGYAENAAALGRLADAVPWVSAAMAASDGGATAVAGLLLGAAGMLEYASPGERDCWQRLARLAAGAPERPAWAFAAARPGNHPARRCRGLAALAARWATSSSPASEVADGVRAQLAQRWPRVWPIFYVRPWIGRGRAQTIAINVALPFAFAAGCEAAAVLYERLPGEPWSRPLRYMDRLLGRPGLRYRSACARQGLLHIFKTACATRSCEGCPAAGRPASDERDALALVGWGERATAAAAHDARPGNPGAAL